MSLTRLGESCRALALVLCCVMLPGAEAQQLMVEGGVQVLVSDLAAAWNRGDAIAFARAFRSDGTFTNVNGTTFEGHDAFEQRHREIFAGPLKSGTTTMSVRRAQLIRADVAVVDVECSTTAPSGQSIQPKLLLVLAKEQGEWTIAAFHNTGVALAACHVTRYTLSVIKTFADRRTQQLYATGSAKRFPPDVAKRAARKLEYLDLATGLDDLKVPPGNRLHALEGDRKGQYSISVNVQWRICFRFVDGDAYDVEICDYH